MLKQVAIIIDDASQYERLLDALSTAIKCSLDPKDRADFACLKMALNANAVPFDQGYHHARGRIAEIILLSTLSNIISHDNRKQTNEPKA